MLIWGSGGTPAAPGSFRSSGLAGPAPEKRITDADDTCLLAARTLPSLSCGGTLRHPAGADVRDRFEAQRHGPGGSV